MTPRMMAPATLAAWLDVSVGTVWRLVKSGEIPAPVRMGERIVRFDRLAIERTLRLEPESVYDDPDEALANGGTHGQNRAPRAR